MTLMPRSESHVLPEWDSSDRVRIDYGKLLIWIASVAVPWAAIATVVAVCHYNLG